MLGSKCRKVVFVCMYGRKRGLFVDSHNFGGVDGLELLVLSLLVLVLLVLHLVKLKLLVKRLVGLLAIRLQKGMFLFL